MRLGWKVAQKFTGKRRFIMAARVVSFAKTIRNNWKKSLFFSGLAAWAGNFAKQKYL
jgi:hypothetical protein